MASSLLERLRGVADCCCQDEGFEESERSIQGFLGLLESPLHDMELKGSSTANWLAKCEEALQQAVELLDPSAPNGLVLCEKIGLELPRVVVKFVSLSKTCQDHCLSIIENLVENCSPREMFAAFMEGEGEEMESPVKELSGLNPQAGTEVSEFGDSVADSDDFSNQKCPPDCRDSKEGERLRRKLDKRDYHLVFAQ